MRWYDSVTGRWLSNDPIGISGGLNQYVFCGNNPVNLRDPFGLCEESERAQRLFDRLTVQNRNMIHELADMRDQYRQHLVVQGWMQGIAFAGGAVMTVHGVVEAERQVGQTYLRNTDVWRVVRRGEVGDQIQRTIIQNTAQSAGQGILSSLGMVAGTGSAAQVLDRFTSRSETETYQLIQQNQALQRSLLPLLE